MGNPITWLAFIYRKIFLGRPFIGYIAVMVLVSVIVGLGWIRAIHNVQSDQQEAKKQELEALGSLMTQGTHLYIASQNTESVLSAYKEWEQRLNKFLEQSLNKGYAARLNTAGIDRPVPRVPNLENQVVIGMTERYRSAMDAFMREIGQSTFSVLINLDADTLKLTDRTKFDELLHPPQKNSP